MIPLDWRTMSDLELECRTRQLLDVQHDAERPGHKVTMDEGEFGGMAMTRLACTCGWTGEWYRSKKMKRQIDPKYSVVTDESSIAIVNATGVPIPLDEPLILFRGRDRLALPMLEAYRNLCVLDGCTDFHMRGIDNRIAAFRKFAATSPTMKQPGITEGR